MAKDLETKATTSDGESVAVKTTERVPDGGLTASGGTVRTTTQPTEAELVNPLGEPLVRVRARPGVEFFHQTILRRGGQEFDMTIPQAEAAALYVDEVMSDGTVKPIQVKVRRTEGGVNLSGMARHERISTLEGEVQKRRLELEGLEKDLETERSALKVDIEKQRAPKTPADSPAFTPGTSGAPGTTSVPPRPGEPGNTKKS